MAAVEYLMRWHQYDPAAAIAAAKTLVAGRYTVKSLEIEERRAREAAGATLKGRAREIAFRDRVARSQTTLFPSFSRTESMPVSSSCAVPYDFLWTGPLGRVPVLVIGPYADPIQYTSRIHDWGLRAMHLSGLFGRSLMVLPEPDMLPRYLGWLSHHGDPADLAVAPEGCVDPYRLPPRYQGLLAR